MRTPARRTISPHRYGPGNRALPSSLCGGLCVLHGLPVRCDAKPTDTDRPRTLVLQLSCAQQAVWPVDLRVSTWVVQTLSGAVVSVAGMALMAILFVAEVMAFASPVLSHEMAVDSTRGEKLPIHLNLSFPSLPCSMLSLDALDMSGKHEVPPLRPISPLPSPRNLPPRVSHQSAAVCVPPRFVSGFGGHGLRPP